MKVYYTVIALSKYINNYIIIVMVYYIIHTI